MENWKKLFIKRKTSGEYFFKFSDLDGSNEVNENILGNSLSLTKDLFTIL